MSYPLIAQGRVFAATQDGILYALDLRNGATLWSRSAGVRSVNLAYDEGRIIAMDDEGFVAAYSPATGATVWASSLTKYVTPVAAGGRVFGAWGITLDGATGARLNLASPIRNDGDVTPSLDGTRAYHASGCGGAAAIRRADLGLAWTGPNNGCATGPYQGPTAVHGGRLYNPDPAYDENGQPGYVHDAATGAIVGRYPDNAPPAFADGVGLFNAAGTLEAQDLSTGATLWSFPRRITQAPLIAQGRVYVADGEQPALDRAARENRHPDLKPADRRPHRVLHDQRRLRPRTRPRDGAPGVDRLPHRLLQALQ